MPDKDTNSENSGLTPAMLRQGFLSAVSSVVSVFLLLFVPAGTWDFWQGWAYLGLFILYFAIGAPYFLKTAPDLIRRRLKSGPQAEEDFSQKVIMSFGVLVIIALFIVPGLDRRFAWSHVPAWLSVLSLACCVVGMVIACYATAYNHYLAATITVEKDQPVISTGPYALVRHPMYSGVGLWFFVTPLALGSWWGMLPGLLVPVMLVFRLVYEERSLKVRLPGYAEYCQKVRWRLIPGLF